MVYLWGHLRDLLLSQSKKGKGKVDETQQFTPLESGSLKHIFAQYNDTLYRVSIHHNMHLHLHLIHIHVHDTYISIHLC